MVELERNERWNHFLEVIVKKERDNDDGDISPTLPSNLFQEEVILESYITIELSETNDFPQLYRQVEQSILIEWFLPYNDDSQNHYEEFSQCPVLAPISDRAKRKIWADTPRTFDIFSRKSGEIEKILSTDETATLFRAILCRILCTSSILLGGWYCQGMAFVAGSCMLYLKEFRTNNLDLLSQQRLGIYSCGIFHYCFMKQNHIEALYRDSILLSAYMSELAFQLSNYSITSPIYNHMSSLGFTVHYFALEWFTACFLLNVSHDASMMLHDLFICGQPDKRNDLLIKMGISIICALSSKILTYTNFETLHMEFKSLVMSLEPVDILMHALEYQMILHHNGGNNSTSILQQLNESPNDLLRTHSLLSSEGKNKEREREQEQERDKDGNLVTKMESKKERIPCVIM